MHMLMDAFRTLVALKSTCLDVNKYGIDSYPTCAHTSAGVLRY